MQGDWGTGARAGEKPGRGGARQGSGVALAGAEGLGQDGEVGNDKTLQIRTQAPGGRGGVEIDDGSLRESAVPLPSFQRFFFFK